MIIKKRRLFFRSLRILLQDENLGELLDKNKYDYITVISYRDLGLDKRDYELMHKKLANIPLTGSAEEILARFSRRTQQEISKTYGIPGLEFRVADPDFNRTYELYKKFELAQGRKPWKRDTFSGTVNFNAYYNGELIASVPCYELFPYLQVRAIFSKRLAEENKEIYKLIGSATRRLVFEACKYGKERGYEFVGLGAVNYSTEQKANVANFKMFFGTQIGDEYTYRWKSRRLIRTEKILNSLKRIFWIN